MARNISRVALEGDSRAHGRGSRSQGLFGCSDRDGHLHRLRQRVLKHAKQLSGKLCRQPPRRR